MHCPLQQRAMPMRKRTPIRIKDGKIYIWICRGKAKERGLPLFKLAAANSKRKGDLILSYPYACEHITAGWEGVSHDRTPSPN